MLFKDVRTRAGCQIIRLTCVDGSPVTRSRASAGLGELPEVNGGSCRVAQLAVILVEDSEERTSSQCFLVFSALSRASADSSRQPETCWSYSAFHSSCCDDEVSDIPVVSSSVAGTDSKDSSAEDEAGAWSRLGGVEEVSKASESAAWRSFV